MRRNTRLCCWTTSVLVLALAWASAAEAAFPGANGKLCFSRHLGGNNTEIFAMNPDGSAQTQLTSNSTEDLNCAWSPDGSQIAFQTNRDGDHEVYVMNADGTAQTNLSNNSAFDGAPGWSPDGTTIAFTSDRDGDNEVFVMDADGSAQTQLTTSPGDDGGPAWSPDGTKIAFSSAGIKVMDPDGSNQTPLTTGASDSQPDWSPDGAKIAFDSSQDGDFEIYSMDADGNNQVQRTANTVVDAGPAWSPDGTKIAFYTDRDNPTGFTEIYAMNADGSSPANLSNDPAIDGGPDWQPLVPSYPRPKGATPIRDALVPAFKECTAPNTTHEAPANVASCVPAEPVSDWLTIGTPLANGQPAKFLGSVRQAVVVGNPATQADEADLAIEVSLTDVRNKGDLSDYTGELEVSETLRITDMRNGPGSGYARSGTASDLSYTFVVPCATTGSTTVGSTCSLTTTADALVGNTIEEGRRAVWEIQDTRVFDGGSDGLASTAPNTLFAVEGLFFP